MEQRDWERQICRTEQRQDAPSTEKFPLSVKKGGRKVNIFEVTKRQLREITGAEWMVFDTSKADF
jgi:hypothetical protein